MIDGVTYTFENMHSDGVIEYDIKYTNTTRGTPVPSQKIESHYYLVYNPTETGLAVLHRISGSDYMVDAIIECEEATRRIYACKVTISDNGRGYKIGLIRSV
jgi:hypothetical protein